MRDVSQIWGTPQIETERIDVRTLGVNAFPVHTISHLFSALLLDTDLFREIPVVALAMDAGPDFDLGSRKVEVFYAGCVSKGGYLQFTPIESPAPLYHAASLRLGREAGTLMALASATRCVVAVDVEEKLEKCHLFGGTQTARSASRFVDDAMSDVSGALAADPSLLDREFTGWENAASAVMKVVQSASETVASRNVDSLLVQNNLRLGDCYLALGGGYALNCPTNSLLMDKGFRGLLIPPCADDSGQALGLGLLAFYTRGDLTNRQFKLTHPYYGGDLGVKGHLLLGWDECVEGIAAFDAEIFVRDISTSPVAWMSGKSEIGPRALGHRCLLGDPRSSATKDLLNAMKGREGWRPVAPVVLEELAPQWFVGARRSPYMLEVFEVEPSRRDEVPAIVHLDGSARVQTLSQSDDPMLYNALTAFFSITGVPLLCNTSLNAKAEPIVEKVGEGINFCLRHGVSLAYFDGQRISLRRNVHVDFPGPEPRSELFAGQEHVRKQRLEELLESGLTPEGLFLLRNGAELRALGESQGVRVASSWAKRVASTDHDFEMASRRYWTVFGPDAKFSPFGQTDAAVVD